MLSYPKVIGWMFTLPNTSCFLLTLPGITGRRIAKVLCTEVKILLWELGDMARMLQWLAQRDTCSDSKIVERNIEEIHSKLALK